MSDNTTNNATDQNPQEDSEFNPWAEQNPSGHWGGRSEPLEEGLTESALIMVEGTARDVAEAIRDLGRFFGL